MAWTPPKQFEEGETLTARDLNIYLRDNLLENEVTKCTTEGAHLTTGPGGELVERKTGSHQIATSEAAPGSNYFIVARLAVEIFLGPLDLGTLGPQVTVETGTRALVFVSAKTNCESQNDMYGNFPIASKDKLWLEVRDHTTWTETNADRRQTLTFNSVPGSNSSYGRFMYLDNLTPGENTFTLRYNNNGNAGGIPSDGPYDSINQIPQSVDYSGRSLVVFPL